jgi:hypothetical protein
LSLQDGIQAVRSVIKKAWFDEQLCAIGISAVEAYRREYDQAKQCFKDSPLHDWTSHLSDALRMLAIAYREPYASEKPKAAPRYLHEMTANDVFWPANTQQKYERI